MTYTTFCIQLVNMNIQVTRFRYFRGNTWPVFNLVSTHPQYSQILSYCPWVFERAVTVIVLYFEALFLMMKNELYNMQQGIQFHFDCV